MPTYNKTQLSPWNRAILPALLQGNLLSVTPKGMAACKTKVAAVIHKSSNQISPLCAQRKRVILNTYSIYHLLWKCQSHFLHNALLKKSI